MKSDYLIVLDLDGTLLPKNKDIPFLTKRYIHKLSKQGYNVVLASGRPAHNVRKFHKDLKLNSPIISLNGLHINYPDNPNKDRRIFFDKNKIREITNEVGKSFKIKNIICETDKYIYITNKDGWLEPDFWLTNMKVFYGTLDENLENDVMTFIFELEDKNFDEDKLKKIFNKFDDVGARCWVGPFHGFVEVYEYKNNKYLAIMDIAKEFNVKKENIYAFGDDLNDIEMLKNLPNAYVMKNAKDNVRCLCKHITKYDNEHQGVKKELKAITKNLK